MTPSTMENENSRNDELRQEMVDRLKNLGLVKSALVEEALRQASERTDLLGGRARPGEPELRGRSTTIVSNRGYGGQDPHSRLGSTADQNHKRR
jgi:hypothetical protein